jgi:hypothetical protein
MAHDDANVLEMFQKSCSMVLVLQGNFDSTDLKDGKILGSSSMTNPLRCNLHVKYLLVVAWNIMVGYRLCSGRWKAWIV